MDGNRRYAEQLHVDKATGHTHGYSKMVEVIHWCLELGVKHITVYAFSIDNFKRGPDEVGALMQLAEKKYIELARDNGLAEREGLQMHIVGDLELPPPAVQGAAARLMHNTAALRTKRAVLNVCFSYTSSEEAVHAAAALQAAVRSGGLRRTDVGPDALHGALRTGPASPPVDLLVRTSGETRLSDFLLWQAAHAHLCYLPTLWPNLSYMEFARCVLSYQRHARALGGLRRRAEERLAAACGLRAAGLSDGGSQEGARRCGAGREHTDDCASADAGRAASLSLAGRSSKARDAAGGGCVDGTDSGADCSGGGSRSMKDAVPRGARRAAASAGGSSAWVARWLAAGARLAASWVTWAAGAPVGVVSAPGGTCHASLGLKHQASAGKGDGFGQQLRLSRFFQQLEDGRRAWIDAHVNLRG